MKIKKNNNTICAKLDESSILLNLDSGEYLQLNESGKEIWDLLDYTKNLNELVSNLSEKYSSDKNNIENDVLIFLKKAEENNLVKLSY